MKIHFLRENTYIIYVDDEKHLVNPFFETSQTPLPMSIKDILKEVNSVILTDKFELTCETLKKIKQKGIKIINESSIDKPNVKKALNAFRSLEYKPANGEILLKEKLL